MKTFRKSIMWFWSMCLKSLKSHGSRNKLIRKRNRKCFRIRNGLEIFGNLHQTSSKATRPILWESGKFWGETSSNHRTGNTSVFEPAIASNFKVIWDRHPTKKKNIEKQGDSSPPFCCKLYVSGQSDNSWQSCWSCWLNHI